MKSTDIKELQKWLKNLLQQEYVDSSDIRQILADFDFEAQQQVKVEPEVIVKLAEERIEKLWKKKIPYVNDECDDIVEDIENEIEQLKQLVNGLKYYMKNISKFSE